MISRTITKDRKPKHIQARTHVKYSSLPVLVLHLSVIKIPLHVRIHVIGVVNIPWPIGFPETSQLHSEARKLFKLHSSTSSVSWQYKHCLDIVIEVIKQHEIMVSKNKNQVIQSSKNVLFEKENRCYLKKLRCPAKGLDLLLVN